MKRSTLSQRPSLGELCVQCYFYFQLRLSRRDDQIFEDAGQESLAQPRLVHGVLLAVVLVMSPPS